MRVSQEDKRALENPTFQQRKDLVDLIDTKLEDLTMRQLRDLPDGTLISSEEHESSMAKVGKYWVDGEYGRLRKLSEIADLDDEAYAERTTWTISHVPVPAGTQQSINRQFALISEMCRDSGLFTGDLEQLSPFQRVQHLLFLCLEKIKV